MSDLSVRWALLLEDGSADAVCQMNRDRELFGNLAPDSTNLVRLYRIDRDQITIGRTHRKPLPAAWSEARVAVRPTGGGAVRHDRDLCLSLVLPFGRAFGRSRDWPLFYRRLHGILRSFLREEGIETRQVTDCPREQSGGEAGCGARPDLCFESPVPGDLMMGSDKVLGGALAISRHGLLYQGSLAVPMSDPAILSKLFEKWYCAEGRSAMDGILSGREGK